MKLLIVLDDLIIGGAQVNAIEIAATLQRSKECEVVIVAGPGPMSELACRMGVRVIPAPYPRAHPSPARVTFLRRTVQREAPTVLNAWDRMASLDAYCVCLTTGTPLVLTNTMMEVTRHLPRWPPITMGTPELVDQARAMGCRRAELVLPPVDVDHNSPGAIDASSFRVRCGIRPDDVTLVVVSRLVRSLKSDSLWRTLDAVHWTANRLQLRLIVVGDGELRPELAAEAARINAALSREAVLLVGALLDPRPAYAAADIVVGMGTSALRGMAFAKPTLVVGERGFSSVFSAESLPRLYYTGLYGLGDGDPANGRLLKDITMLVEARHRWVELGSFCRRFVVEHFSLERNASRLLDVCCEAARESQPITAKVVDGLRTAALYARYRRFLWRFDPSAPSVSADNVPPPMAPKTTRRRKPRSNQAETV